MELHVQFRQPGELVEDGTNEWTGTPRQVATLYIPRQNIGPDNIWLGQNLSMNPARAPLAHKPVGGIGFLRGILYQRQAWLRASLNGGVVRDSDGMPAGWQERFAGQLSDLAQLMKQHRD